MSLALIFSGQGHQHTDMLPWLDGDALIHRMESMLQVTDWREAMKDREWAEHNVSAQLLITATSLSALERLSTCGLPTADVVAGYSVGELAAFCTAGVYSADTALDLAWARAVAMSRSAEGAAGGLLSITGIGPDQAARLGADAGLSMAIHVGPDAYIFGGHERVLNDTQRAIEAQGFRCQRLRVGVASHTPFMASAARTFREVLLKTACSRPTRSLIANATGERVTSKADAVDALCRQIESTVRWMDCMDGIYSRRVTCVLEVGPGRALAKLWNDMYPDVPARACDDFRSAKSVVDWVCEAAVARR